MIESPTSSSQSAFSELTLAKRADSAQLTLRVGLIAGLILFGLGCTLFILSKAGCLHDLVDVSDDRASFLGFTATPLGDPTTSLALFVLTLGAGSTLFAGGLLVHIKKVLAQEPKPELPSPLQPSPRKARSPMLSSITHINPRAPKLRCGVFKGSKKRLQELFDTCLESHNPKGLEWNVQGKKSSICDIQKREIPSTPLQIEVVSAGFTYIKSYLVVFKIPDNTNTIRLVEHGLSLFLYTENASQESIDHLLEMQIPEGTWANNGQIQATNDPQFLKLSFNIQLSISDSSENSI